MTSRLSPNTEAALLLTAPLLVGGKRDRSAAKPLAAGEYRRLARQLRQARRQPADLLEPDGLKLVSECRIQLDSGQLEGLLARARRCLLSQAMEQWDARKIWVAGRGDPAYPQSLEKRLGDDSPALLYGCGGNPDLLGTRGGLAVVGSRNISDTLMQYASFVGQLAADAGRKIVSGGARGVDQAAMHGALEAGGCVAGILANGLERAAREYRGALMDGKLVLACPYDPAVRFLVGHAMQRNKLIYALSDAALVVNADYKKGGTWAGATEQLGRLKLGRLKHVRVYVRATGEPSRGLDGLRERGASLWPDPDPTTAAELRELLDRPQGVTARPEQPLLPLGLSLDTQTAG